MSNKFTNHSENPDDLKHVEQTLTALSPRPPQVDRDRLMFLAGAASVQGAEVAKARGAWSWPAASAALAATSLALAIALVVRTNAPPQVVYIERPAVVPAMSPRVAIQTVPSPNLPAAATDTVATAPHRAVRPTPNAPAPSENYLRSREVALRMGLDALGTQRSTGGAAASPMTYFDWLSGLDRAATATPGGSLDSELPKM